ncbi:hypothetical protein T440DRAFT_515208 [Plenodomus tracheiphilus IPT5]|uniref:N-acetyltransferase domain-containing protein n=1 Tax=Plenodomus tracheiphilus IPT5 TaxID=1408161 RepID=A0A6A7BH41_9PLEO|nr:hypothetical protein T440DRAFT_515208 [Plenodomus tracheiphilus IPT5]
MLDYNFHIKTPRLYISHYNPNNQTHCQYVATQHLVHTMTPEDKSNGKIPTLEEGRTFITTGAKRMAKTGYGRFLISLRPLNETVSPSATPTPSQADQKVKSSFSERILEPIGTASMQLARFPHAPTIPDVGFGLSNQHWGKGYATEAAQGLLNYYEEVRGQTQVLGIFMPENGASKGVFRRLGFEERGVWEMDGVIGEGKVLRACVWSKGVGRGVGELEAYGLVRVV